MRNTKDALNWIVKILRQNNVPFQISGGMAARIYGSQRELADIDIELPDHDILKIAESVKPFIIYGPKRYMDEEFDLLLMTLKFKSQEIDLCGIDSQKLFNKKTKKWEKEQCNLGLAVKKRIYNLIIPVIPLNDLITYKQKIARKVDLDDLEAF